MDPLATAKVKDLILVIGDADVLTMAEFVHSLDDALSLDNPRASRAAVATAVMGALLARRFCAPANSVYPNLTFSRIFLSVSCNGAFFGIRGGMT